MKVWIQKYPNVLIDFPRRAKNLASITNEAIEFLMQCETIKFNKADIEIAKILRKSKQNNILDEEMIECFSKADHLGKWFARSGTVENIYECWGVCP